MTLLCSCLPLNKFKAAIVLASTVIFFGGVSLFSGLFMLVPLTSAGRTLLLCLAPLTLIQLLIRSDQLRKEKITGEK